jgi:hypothetical protein
LGGPRDHYMTARAAVRYFVSVAVPSTAGALPLPLSAPAEICTRRGLRCSGLGMWTSSTPRSNFAEIPSGSTPSGSVSDRLKLPNERSMRYQPRSRDSCSAARSPEIVSAPSWT